MIHFVIWYSYSDKILAGGKDQLTNFFGEWSFKCVCLSACELDTAHRPSHFPRIVCREYGSWAKWRCGALRRWRSGATAEGASHVRGNATAPLRKCSRRSVRSPVHSTPIWKAPLPPPDSRSFWWVETGGIFEVSWSPKLEELYSLLRRSILTDLT